MNESTDNFSTNSDQTTILASRTEAMFQVLQIIKDMSAGKTLQWAQQMIEPYESIISNCHFQYTSKNFELRGVELVTQLTDLIQTQLSSPVSDVISSGVHINDIAEWISSEITRLTSKSDESSSYTSPLEPKLIVFKSKARSKYAEELDEIMTVLQQWKSVKVVPIPLKEGGDEVSIGSGDSEHSDSEGNSHVQWKTKYELLLARITMESEDYYADAMVKYEKERKVYEDHQQFMRKIEQDIKNLSIVQILLGGVRYAQDALATKIINELKPSFSNHYHQLSDVLNSTTLMKSGEYVLTPMDRRNVSAMMQALTTRFMKPGIHSFMNEIQQGFNLGISKEHILGIPMKAVSSINKIISRWESIDMSKHLTPDILYTSMLLNAIKPNEDLSYKIHVALQEEKNTTKFQNSSSIYPIYNFVSDKIQSETSLKSKSKYRSNNDEYNHSNNSSNNTQPKHHSVAFVTQSDSKAGTQFPKIQSTNVPCEVCLAAAQDSKKLPHKPKCFLGRCFICKKYGHRNTECTRASDHTEDNNSKIA
jgi:hypothetical protein